MSTPHLSCGIVRGNERPYPGISGMERGMWLGTRETTCEVVIVGTFEIRGEYTCLRLVLSQFAFGNFQDR